MLLRLDDGERSVDALVHQNRELEIWNVGVSYPKLHYSDDFINRKGISGQEEYFESDAFIPEWSQKSPNAFLQFEAERSNHLIQANTERTRRALQDALEDPRIRVFFLPLR